MDDNYETGRFRKIALEAREESPLFAELRFFGFLFGPIWVLGVGLAVGEILFPSLPDKVFGTVNMALIAYVIVVIVSAIFLAKRADERQAEPAKNTGEPSRYQLGIGAVKIAMGDWIYRAAAIPLVLLLILSNVVGADSTELTESARFWYAQEIIAFFACLIFCFLGFCVWLGDRIQKQRAAQ